MTFEQHIKDGKIVGWKATVCVGRENGRQKWKTLNISADDPRLEDIKRIDSKESVARRIALEFEEQEKAAFKEKQEKGKSVIDKDKATVSEFIDLFWIENIKANKPRPNTLAFYQHMSNHISEYFKRLPIKQQRIKNLDAVAVKQYIIYLQTTARTKDGKPYSDTTIIRHYQTLRNIINTAVRFDFLDKDPCAKLAQGDKPKKEDKPVVFLPPDKADAFLAAADTEPLFWRSMMYVLLLCGLRRGEAAGLQWGDISKDGKTITIRRSITPDPTSDLKYHEDTPKSKKARPVPLDSRVYNLLMELKADQENKLGENVKLAKTAYVFARTDDRDKPIYPTAITKWQAGFVKRHGLPNVSPHDLRHTTASLLQRAGVQTKTIQAMLGHNDESTTNDFYIGVDNDAMQAAMGKLVNLVFPQSEKKTNTEKAQ